MSQKCTESTRIPVGVLRVRIRGQFAILSLNISIFVDGVWRLHVHNMVVLTGNQNDI